MPMIRVQDLESLAAAHGFDLPGFGGAAKLSPTEVDRLARGEAIRVKAATETRVAKLLDLRVKDLRAGDDEAGEGAPANDVSDDDYRDASYSDADPVVSDVPAPQRPARDVDEEPTAPPMELALYAALAAGEGRYRDDDLELVGAVLSLGEAPSGVSRRELQAIARGWLELAVTVRGQEDAAAALLERAQTDGEGRVRAMALKIAARVAAQTRAERGARRAAPKAKAS